MTFKPLFLGVYAALRMAYMVKLLVLNVKLNLNQPRLRLQPRRRIAIRIHIIIQRSKQYFYQLNAIPKYLCLRPNDDNELAKLSKGRTGGD